MGDKKTITVAILGITDHERNILKSIFKLSQYRNYTYTLIPISESGQILIVDADDPEAMAQWNMLFGGISGAANAFSSNSSQPSISTVMVSKDKALNEYSFHIRRPFVTTHVLSLLDQVAGKLSFSPQASITNEQPIMRDSVKSPPMATALVVDDSSTIRKQIEVELRPFNIQVDAVESGEEAFVLLSQKIYDMIFLDVMLPGIDGYQICRKIKKDKAIKNIPVVMLTSKSSPFDWIKGNLAGCDTYLTKPVKQDSFQKVVKKYLKPT
jgi:two-component system cell cycle response regulator